MHPGAVRVIGLLSVSISIGAATAVASCTGNNNPGGPTADGGPLIDATNVPLDTSTPADTSTPGDTSAPDAGADTGNPIDAGHDTGTDASVTCAWDAAIELDASGYDGEAGPDFNGDDGGTLVGPAPPLCSGPDGGAETLTVVNNAPCPVDLWWIDFACKEEFYKTIPGLSQFSQPTFAFHPWRLRAVGTEQLLLEIAPAPDTAPRTITYP